MDVILTSNENQAYIGEKIIIKDINVHITIIYNLIRKEENLNNVSLLSDRDIFIVTLEEDKFPTKYLCQVIRDIIL